MYTTIPIHWNIKSAPAGPGRSRAGPALYVFILLDSGSGIESLEIYHTVQTVQYIRRPVKVRGSPV
jgi:hypothetical protein